MTTVKHLFISLLVLFGYTTGAWAIEQDSDGYYLIGSVQDWKDFAALVQTTPTANAKMTADVDLGDDQTRIGDVAGNEYGAKFGGIFDGQGHTLTVAYNITGQNMCAPFTKTNGATIKNLHVAGTMRTEFCHLAGIIADAYGNNTIENVWVSADLTSANNYNSGGRILDLCGAFVGCKKTGTLSISNGLFSGSITTENGSIWNGAFLGYIDGENQSSATITNCLSVGTFSYIEHETTIPNRGTNTYCYVKQFPTTIPSEMRVTDEQLADGTIATALGDAWVQDAITGQPMLKIFTTMRQDEDGYYLIGSVTDWRRFADIVNSGTNPAANAKMIADIDLGDDQTMVGDGYYEVAEKQIPFKGIFDGQGHTLTIHYVTSEVVKKYSNAGIQKPQYLGCAPFGYLWGGTIKNLHTAGTIIATHEGVAGIVGYTYDNATIENCYSSVNITFADTHRGAGGISYYNYGTALNINNCLYDGTITGGGTPTGAAGFVCYRKDGDIYINNSLMAGSFVNIGPDDCCTFVRYNDYSHINNSYYKTALGTIQGTQATAEELANGTTATALQNSNTEEIWVQDPVLGIPMLKLFANYITYKVPSSGIGTFSAKGQVLLPEGLTAYYCKTYNKENAAISVFGIDGNIVPAATGVLLEGEPGATFTLMGACGEAPTITDNELVAVTEPTHINTTDGAYTNFMMSGGKFIRIADESENVKMPANRAYLPLLTADISGSNAKEIMLLWDDKEATGIESLTPGPSPMGEGSIYNLNGQKLSSPLKGINIINGRKVIVK